MKTFAFIDSQNLNLGTSKDIYKKGKLVYKGWKIDFRKFFIYLKDKYRIDKAFLFIGYIIEYQNYDKAVVVSGDGDFYCLYEYLQKKNKLKSIIIPNMKSASSLLKKFEKYKLLLETKKSKLEYKKNEGRSPTTRSRKVVSLS